MGKGGGGTTQSTGTTYNTNIPEYAEPYVNTMLGATQKQLFNMEGNEITGFKPYTPYSSSPSDYVAPFSPMQEQAFRGVSQLGPSQLGEMGGQMAGAATMGALGTDYDPYRMGQFTSGRAAQYMNPFLEQAMEPQLREAQRASEMQRVADQGQATRAGAFGGSRQAIVEAERQRNLGMQQGDIRAKGYMSAFDQAQQNFAREQQMREQSRQFGAGLGIQGLQTALQGANTMGQLGQTQFGQQQTALGMQQQAGAMQQSMEQQKINQAIQDYANAQQYPLMQLGVMSNMLRGLPMQAATTNQYVAAPNPITQGIGAAGTYASLQNAGMFGKTATGAAGGLPSEFKYAEGGIAAVPRYDVGGEVESQLESMDSANLAKQAQESSSPTVRRMAQRILRERQMERGADQSAAPTGPMGIDYQAAQGMASGGIIAFQSGERVTDPDRLAAQTAAYVTGAQEAARLRREQEPVQETDFMFSEGPARPSITRGLQTLGRGISQAVARPAAPRLQFDSEDQAAPAPEARSAPAPEARPAQAAQPAAATAAAPTRSVTPAAAADTSGIRTAAPGGPAPRPATAPRPAAAASEGITQAQAPRGVGEGRQSSVEAEGAAPAYTGALADIQKMVAAAGAEAGRTEDSFLTDVKKGQPENVAAAEYRKQIMAERANSKDEAERQRHMRMAEFFARWGSTPGPTLAAGLKALEKSIPDIIGDEKEQKKIRRELDKVQFDIDNSIRLEQRGDMKEARTLKENARNRFMNLNERYAQVLGAQQTAETSASASRYAAEKRLEGEKITAAENRKGREQRAGETADDKKYQRLQVSRDQENRVLNQIATEKDKEVHKADLRTAALREDGKVPAGMEQRVADAQRRIAEREADWDRRSKAAAGSVDEARRRVTGEVAPATAPAATTTVSRADIEATARASGKTVAEVEAAARAKGYTIK